MIWSLKVHNMYNQLGTQGCSFFFKPPPPSHLNDSVCIASSSIKTFNATQQLGNGLLPLWHPNNFFWCALLVWGLKKIDTTVGKIDTDDLIN